MTEDSITVEILKSIRDEMRGMREEIRTLRSDTNERLDKTNERLDRVIHEQIRHATAIVDLEAGQRTIVRELQGLNQRIDNVLTGPLGATVKTTSERVDRLEARLERIEAREG